jgi:hypothetical protein
LFALHGLSDEMLSDRGEIFLHIQAICIPFRETIKLYELCVRVTS